MFAFSATHLQSHLLEVAVKAKDLAGGDDLVGRVAFDLAEVPIRVPPDSPLAPQWYRLETKRGEKLPRSEIHAVRVARDPGRRGLPGCLPP